MKRPVSGQKRGRSAMRFWATLVIALSVLTVPALAAPSGSGGGSDPLTIVNNLSDFIFSIIRALGIIILGWGVVQVGLSFQGHDPSQRAQGIMTLAGGLVVTFSKEILDLITAGP